MGDGYSWAGFKGKPVSGILRGHPVARARAVSPEGICPIAVEKELDEGKCSHLDTLTLLNGQ